MAEKIYSLYDDEEILDQQLAVEIGTGYVVLVAGVAGRSSGLEYYSTQDDLAESLEDISRESLLIQKNYSATRIFYNLEEAMLVPAGQFNSAVAGDFLDVAFGSKPSARVNVENINAGDGIVNVYRSNERWLETIDRHFRVVTKRHLFSKLVEDTLASHIELRLVFYKDSFIVVAANDGQLKVARRFEFGNEADVLYHVLNTCQQVDINISEIPVYISGIIEQDAPAFRLLEKYADLIVIDDLAHDALPGGQQDTYPRHYFTSFINLLS